MNIARTLQSSMTKTTMLNLSEILMDCMCVGDVLQQDNDRRGYQRLVHLSEIINLAITVYLIMIGQRVRKWGIDYLMITVALKNEDGH